MIETTILEIVQNNIDVISSNHTVLTKLRIHLKLNVLLKDWLIPARNIKGAMIRWITKKTTIFAKAMEIAIKIVSAIGSLPSCNKAKASEDDKTLNK